LADRIAGHRARLAQLVERRAQLDRESEESRQAVATYRQNGEALAERLAERGNTLQQLVDERDRLEDRRKKSLA
jgi:septal ring factor EnvC (AmiA/AmiB activator)